MHTAAKFALEPVNVSAESVSHSTPAARVTWNITAPLQCVTVVRVDFRLTSSRGPVAATNTTTNTSQTEFIQTGLQCGRDYYIRVVVTGATSDGIHPTVRSSPVQVFVGGKGIVCMRFSWYRNLMVVMLLPSQIHLLQFE